MARLGDYVKIRTGKLDANASSENGKYPFFTCSVEPLKIDTYSYDCECVLVAGNGDLNVKYYNGKFDAYQRTYIVESYDKKILSVPYLYCFLDGYVDELRKQSIGGVIKYIKLGNLTEAQIPMCTVYEQNTIVRNINKVDNLISLRKQQLSKLDELVKARFVELFGTTGKQVPLTDYVWFQEGPGVRSVDFTDDGTILLTGSNINNNTISFGHKSDRHISYELASGKYAHFMCDKDDILVVSSAIDPDKFDKKVVVVNDDKKYCLNTGIIRFKPNKQYLTLGYFREFLKTDYFKHQVISEMRGIAQMHFGPSHLKQMTILLPDSIERQIDFESFVQQTDRSKFEIQKSLEKLETLKKALMQKYFG